MIKINFTNNYISDIGFVNQADNNVWLSVKDVKDIDVVKIKSSKLIESAQNKTIIFFVAGLGEVLIEYLGDTIIPGYQGALTKSTTCTKEAEVDADGKNTSVAEYKSEYYKYAILIRYCGTELYAGGDNEGWQIDLSVDTYGTLKVDKVSEGSCIPIQIPEFDTSAFH